MHLFLYCKHPGCYARHAMTQYLFSAWATTPECGQIGSQPSCWSQRGLPGEQNTDVLATGFCCHGLCNDVKCTGWELIPVLWIRRQALYPLDHLPPPKILEGSNVEFTLCRNIRFYLNNTFESNESNISVWYIVDQPYPSLATCNA